MVANGHRVISLLLTMGMLLQALPKLTLNITFSELKKLWKLTAIICKTCVAFFISRLSIWSSWEKEKQKSIIYAILSYLHHVKPADPHGLYRGTGYLIVIPNTSISICYKDLELWSVVGIDTKRYLGQSIQERTK